MARTWLKIDDCMVENPKFVDLSPFGWTLWLHGVSYCSRNLTDGHIPQAMLGRLCSVSDPSRAAQELVDAELWHVTDTGWMVHDYLDHQRSRSEVEQERESAAERKRKSRARHAEVTPASRVTPPTESVSVTDGSISSSTDGFNTGTWAPSDEEHEAVAELIETVATAVARNRLRNQATPVRNPGAWTRRCLGNLRTDDGGAWWANLVRLCVEFPSAPVDTLAGAAEGERADTLTHYRREAS